MARESEIRNAVAQDDRETAREMTRELWREQTEFTVEEDGGVLRAETDIDGLRGIVRYQPDGQVGRAVSVIFEPQDGGEYLCVEVEATVPLTLETKLQDALKQMRRATRERRQARQAYRRRAL